MAGQLNLSLRGHRTGLITVSDLVRMVRDTLDAGLGEGWVVGEISNARLAPSNHFYFTLKDSRSAINVVMFKSAFQRMRFKVVDGMEVIVRGRVQVFEQRGALQLYAEEMEPRGVGALAGRIRAVEAAARSSKDCSIARANARCRSCRDGLES